MTDQIVKLTDIDLPKDEIVAAAEQRLAGLERDRMNVLLDLKQTPDNPTQKTRLDEMTKLREALQAEIKAVKDRG